MSAAFVQDVPADESAGRTCWAIVSLGLVAEAEPLDALASVWLGTKWPAACWRSSGPGDGERG